MTSVAMSPLLQVACLVLAFCVSPSVSTSVSTSSAPGPIPSAKCDLCSLVAHDLVVLGENATEVQHVISELQTKCNATFKNHSLEKEVCDDLVKGLMELVPLIDNDLIGQLAWDSSNLCSVAGICQVSCCDRSKPQKPEQLHLSLLENDRSQMHVMWTTFNDTATHVVQWGTDASNLSSTSSISAGSSSTYHHFGWLGFLHRATLTGLSPDTTYYYRVGCSDANVFSDVQSFKTFPTDIGTTAHPLRIAVVGDMGYGKSSDATVQRMTELVQNQQIDMVIHNGDISYADGEMEHWDVFMRKVG